MACGARITSKHIIRHRNHHRFLPPIIIDQPTTRAAQLQPANCERHPSVHTSRKNQSTGGGRRLKKSLKTSSRSRPRAPTCRGGTGFGRWPRCLYLSNHLGRHLQLCTPLSEESSRLTVRFVLERRADQQSRPLLCCWFPCFSKNPVGREGKGRSASDGHRRRRFRVLLLAEDSPPSQEEEAVPDGGDEGSHRLRRLRAQGEEGVGGHEGRELRGGDSQAEQGDGDGVRGRRQGDAPRRLQDGQAGGAVALRALRDGGAPLRPGSLRQEGARRVRPQRRRRPHRRAARQGLVHRGQVHRGVQRREPQRMLRHVDVVE